MGAKFNFDLRIDRTDTHSSKWEKYAGVDVLPFWVADMDFAAPDFVLDAVRERLTHEIIGYTVTPESLNDAFITWLQRNYRWSVAAEWLVWIPGVVTGFNLAARAVAVPDGSIMIPTPVYYPFLSVGANTEQKSVKVPLVLDSGKWRIDLDACEDAMEPGTRMFMISNPQNPTGRAYGKVELVALADFCLEHDLYLCSDEIHSQIILDPSAQHFPIASLSAEIAGRTITLFAATKTYNIPGLSCAVAVIPDTELRHAFIQARAGLVPHIGPLSLTASEAAFRDESSYTDELLSYLRGNLARLQEVVGARMTPVEATYLAWIDMNDSPIARNPGRNLEQHGLGLSDGAAFGGSGYVRFNFACPRSLLDEGLNRYADAMQALGIS